MKKSIRPLWKKNKIFITLVAIFIFLLIILPIIYFRYYGTLIFWINNFEESCNDKGCYNYTFDIMYIDEIVPSKELASDISIPGGDYWSVETRSFHGKHTIIILEGNSKMTVFVEVMGGETTCFEMVLFKHDEYNPGYLRSNNCPS